MGRTNEFTLVAEAGFAPKKGQAVVVKAGELIDRTAVASVAKAGQAIDGIITDITVGGPLAVGRVGDIVFALAGAGNITVGDELVVGADGALVKAGNGVAVAKALGNAKEGELAPVLIK